MSNSLFKKIAFSFLIGLIAAITSSLLTQPSTETNIGLQAEVKLGIRTAAQQQKHELPGVANDLIRQSFYQISGLLQSEVNMNNFANLNKLDQNQVVDILSSRIEFSIPELIYDDFIVHLKVYENDPAWVSEYLMFTVDQLTLLNEGATALVNNRVIPFKRGPPTGNWRNSRLVESLTWLASSFFIVLAILIIFSRHQKSLKLLFREIISAQER